MALIDGHNAQNAATHVPYANVRTLACGFARTTPPDDVQMREIKPRIREGMEARRGRSFDRPGLYQPVSRHDGRNRNRLHGHRAVWRTLRHAHPLQDRPLARAREAVEIGRRSKAKVHISHLKGGSEQEVQEVLDFIDRRPGSRSISRSRFIRISAARRWSTSCCPMKSGKMDRWACCRDSIGRRFAVASAGRWRHSPCRCRRSHRLDRDARRRFAVWHDA